MIGVGFDTELSGRPARELLHHVADRDKLDLLRRRGVWSGGLSHCGHAFPPVLRSDGGLPALLPLAWLRSSAENQAITLRLRRESKQRGGTVVEWRVTGISADGKTLTLAGPATTVVGAQKVTIYGAGVIGCEYASIFINLGAKVTLVNTQDRLLSFLDDEIAEASAMGALTMMASTFINAQQIDYEKFRQETRDIIAHVKKKL